MVNPYKGTIPRVFTKGEPDGSAYKGVSRVDGGFGQAEAVVGTDHLLIQVRCDGANAPSRGQEALIIHYDDEREAYLVEPLEGNG